MLTAKQKKIIRKNVRNLALEELAGLASTSSTEVKLYLKKIWRKEKFEKYIQKTPEAVIAPKTLGLKNWFKENWYIILGLTVLIFLIYVNGLNGAFVSDDINWIPKNPNIGNFSSLLQRRDRPAVWLIFFLAHAVGGLKPIFYRLPNLFFHIGNCLAILFLLELKTSRKVAVFTSLLFAVHPILVESVTWIAGGSYAAYCFFFLLSFICYLLSKESRRKIVLYIFAAAFFIISLLFSEKAIVLFLIFPIYEIAFGSLAKNIKSIIPYLIGGVFLAVVFSKQIAGRLMALKTYNYVPLGLDNPFIKIPISLTEYLRLIFWPNDLTLYHADLSMSFAEYFFRVGILLTILALLALSYWRIRGSKTSLAFAFWKDAGVSFENFRNERHFFFWFSVFLVSLLPTITPLRIASTVAERYAYLGTVGILAIFALFLEKISQKEKFRTYVYWGFAVILIALSVRTIVRNRDWISEDNLWIASAKTSPSSPNVLLNLGDMYARHGEHQKAIESLKKAIELDPGYADAYHNLGNTQLELAKKTQDRELIKQAVGNFLSAVKYNPFLWQSYQNLGFVYFTIGEFDKAIEYSQKAIEINSSDLDLQYNLGVIYFESGNPQKAREIFLSILNKDPDNQKALTALNSPEFKAAQ